MSSFLRRYAWWLLAAHGLAAANLYGVAAHHPIRDAWIVPALPIDNAIPLVPGAAWLYATYVLLMPCLVAVTRHRPGFPQVFITATGCALLNAVVYILFPTSLPARTPAPDGTLLALIQTLDTTLCALPSGHVALPTSLAVGAAIAAAGRPQHARWWRGAACGFAIWAVLLAVSTLLTKQHYLVDAVAGAVFGTAVACVAAATAERYRLFTSSRHSARLRPELDGASST